MDITNMTTTGDDNTEAVEDTGLAADKFHSSEFDKFISAFETEESGAVAKSRIEAADSLEKEVPEAEAVPPEVVPPEATKGEDRGLERVAAKEKEVRELRTAFETERNKYLDEKRQFEQERTSLINPQALTEALMLDTAGTLTKLGVDSERVMKSLLYSKLPDNHPSKAKLREELRDLDTRRQMRTLEDKLASKDRETAQRVEYEKTVTELGKYVNTLKEGSEHLPTVSKVAKDNLEYLNKRVLREIVEDARERYLRGETGDPLTFETAASRVEEDLSVLAKLFGSKPPSENTVGDIKKSTEAPEIPSVTKPKLPPPNRVKKELTIEDLEERALINAVAEYERAESRRSSGYTGR